MPVTGLDTAARDLGRRSMMAMKDQPGGGLSGLPPEAFVALTERVRIAEDRLQATPTKSELARATTRATLIGAAVGTLAGAALGAFLATLLI